MSNLKAIANIQKGNARNFIEYTPEYKELVRKAYDKTVDPSIRAEALKAHAAQLDEIIKLLRPSQSTYREYIAEIQTMESNVQPTYFLRRREGGEVQYLNTQDGVMNHQRVVPGQRYSVPPLHYTETATWPEFEIWEDLNARDESLAQLALAMEVSIDSDAWSLIYQSIAATPGKEIVNTTGNVMTFAKLDQLKNTFIDEGFGDMMDKVHFFMNSTAWADLKADARSNGTGELFEELKSMSNYHLLPKAASNFGDYGFFIPDAGAVAAGNGVDSRVFAILPMNYSREYIVKSGGQEMYIEDYIPNAAGFERGVKGISRISRVILDTRKAACLAYK